MRIAGGAWEAAQAELTLAGAEACVCDPAAALPAPSR